VAVGLQRRSRASAIRSTSTIAGDGSLVPWLAAEGPLGYRPEQPPERDYYFQYGWVLPEVFAEGVQAGRHRYFGASFKEQASELLSFWASARRGELDPVFLRLGLLAMRSSPHRSRFTEPPWTGAGRPMC
jgi:hypothetical protein